MIDKKPESFQEGCISDKSNVPQKPATIKSEEPSQTASGNVAQPFPNQSDKKFATVSNEVERRDESDQKPKARDDKVVKAQKNIPQSSAFHDGKVTSTNTSESNSYYLDSEMGLKPRRFKEETPTSEKFKTPQPPQFHPVMGERDEAETGPEDFAAALPPSSLLLSQISTFSQYGVYQATPHDAPTASTLANFYADPRFNHEDFGPTTPYASARNEEELSSRMHSRLVWQEPFARMNNSTNNSPLENPFALSRLFAESDIVQTPQGPAVLIPSQYLGLIDIQSMDSMASPRVPACNRKFKRWTEEEDNLLKFALSREGNPPYNWKRISKKYFSNERSSLQCKSRWTKSLQPGVQRGGWQQHEDDAILQLKSKGMKWSDIADLLPGRLGEHVRDRFVNFLDPNLKKTPWTAEEDAILFREQRRIGNRWTEIAKFLPGRSENSVKNRWHNAKMTQRRRMRKQANERTRLEQKKRAREHFESETSTLTTEESMDESSSCLPL